MPVVENLPDHLIGKQYRSLVLPRLRYCLRELTPMIMQMVLRELEVLVMNVGKWLGNIRRDHKCYPSWGVNSSSMSFG
jgi:hypothetical protein